MRRLLILLITFVLLSSNSFAQNFTDIAELHPNYRATAYLRNHGVINGYKDKTFKPYNKISRAELLKIVMESSEQSIQNPTTNCFSDIPYTEWYAKYICTAKSLSIIEGYKEDNTFHPDQNISKAEAMKIISKGYDWNEDYGLESAILAEEYFKDTPSAEWFTGYVIFGKWKNLLPETNSDYYYPHHEITRGNVAEVIFRYLAITELEKDIFSKDLIGDLDFNSPIKKPSDGEPKNNPEEDATLAPGIITVTLRWDNVEVDLDSHFLQPNSAEIYFMRKIDENLNVILESKVLSEILTINNLGNGSYEYFVHEFTGSEDFNNAKVEIHDSKGLAKIYNVPEGSGTIWKVFEIDKEHKVTDINTIGNCDLIKNDSIVCPST